MWTPHTGNHAACLSVQLVQEVHIAETVRPSVAAYAAAQFYACHLLIHVTDCPCLVV